MSATGCEQCGVEPAKTVRISGQPMRLCPRHYRELNATSNASTRGHR